MFSIKWLTSTVFLILLSLIIGVSTVQAQQGCCSWHDGISHCGSNGRYVCNDGTYSPSCTCRAPTPVFLREPSIIPSNTNGTWQFIENSTGGIDLHFDWDRPDGRGYSITLNKSAGADPGPLADTTKSEYVFKNVTSGKWYINLKEMINGEWSQVAYWEVEIPANVAAQAVPYYSPTPMPKIVTKAESQKESTENDSDSMGLLTALALAVGVPGFIVYAGKNG